MSGPSTCLTWRTICDCVITDVVAALASVPLRIQIRNEEDGLVVDRLQDVAAAAFNAARSADVNIALPAARWPAGSYLLTIESTLCKTTARRDSRFTVR